MRSFRSLSVSDLKSLPVILLTARNRHEKISSGKLKINDRIMNAIQFQEHLTLIKAPLLFRTCAAV